MRSFRCFAVATLAPSLFVAACSAAPDSGTSTEDVGRATAAITQVPSQVSCIEIDVTGARSVTQRFTVTAGQTYTLSLESLPVGSDTFTASAYSVACSAVTSTTQPTWLSVATQTAITSGAIASVPITLRPNGEAAVGISFQGDDAGAVQAAISVAMTASPGTLCSGLSFSEGGTTLAVAGTGQTVTFPLLAVGTSYTVGMITSDTLCRCQTATGVFSGGQTIASGVVSGSVTLSASCAELIP